MNIAKIEYSDDTLKLEVSLWHQQIFRFPPSANVIYHYVQANRKYEPYINTADQVFIQNLCRAKADLESVEYFWRFLNKKNALTQKKMVLFSICELFPEYKNHFNNFTSDNSLKAFLILSYYFVRSFFKLIKGSLIFLFVRLRYENS